MKIATGRPLLVTLNQYRSEWKTAKFSQIETGRQRQSRDRRKMKRSGAREATLHDYLMPAVSRCTVITFVLGRLPDVAENRLLFQRHCAGISNLLME